jgi:small subunit ribosomal protein S6
VLLDFEAPAPVVAELERQTQINEDVIRYMTLKVDGPRRGPVGHDAPRRARP